MSDIIQLLPDSLANQIAAGEVVQRPASVVKELLENAVDAGSTTIKLIVKDAGRSLVQVIDNGSGMSETDARLCFERHATSKIKSSDDLFAIRTMGFRGEALASIAAVAQVELRTRQVQDDLGTRIVVEGSVVKVQEPCQHMEGASFSVKNLFYNTPARRKFLKSNPVEMRHILDEFQRIALAHPDIFFSIHHNNIELFHLPPGNLRQRIVNILGDSANKKLVPVSVETDIVKISGFVGKPEFSKKTRGDQYFFVNGRYIKSSYLNHAVMSGYEDLLPTDAYPLYVLFMTIEPSLIDVNMHPTKQEIKFEDERLIYNYLKVAVRHALGQHAITPSLDFEPEPSILAAVQQTQVAIDDEELQTQTFSSRMNTPTGNDYAPIQKSSRHYDPTIQQTNNLKNWRKLYDDLDMFDSAGSTITIPSALSAEVIDSDAGNSLWSENEPNAEQQIRQRRVPYQVHNSYIITHIKSGFLIIDQQAAHERILYERYLAMMNDEQATVQKELFPRTITLSPADTELLGVILPQINQLGFDIQEFGAGTFVIHGKPADMDSNLDEQHIVETLLEQYKENIALKLDMRENLARSMARSAATKRGQALAIPEMQELIDKLFACALPHKSPSGRNCFVTFEFDVIEKWFFV